METRVFIISTRRYPLNKNTAWSKAFCLDIDISSIDSEFRSEYHEYQSDYYNKSQVIIKQQKFDGYIVFIVPCLNGAADKEIRYSFLNNLINRICKTVIVAEDNVFLIAHDKDFGSEKNLRNVVATDEIDKRYRVLNWLRGKKHIFLFQHKPGGIFDIIKKVPLTTNNDSFSVDSCNELYELCKKINS